LLTEAVPARALGGPIEIWFQDEGRVGQKGTKAYIWVPISSRPLMVHEKQARLGLHLLCDLPGTRPRCGDNHVGGQCRGDEHHLKVIGAQVSPGAHNVLVCDGAEWACVSL
jgi:hypothetical protein